jgi:uncharacterized protein YjbJ (UPF0337 family)
MNRLDVDGKIDKAKGTVQRKIGELTGDEHLQNIGRDNEVKGAVKDAAGDVKDAAAGVKDAAKRAAAAVERGAHRAAAEAKRNRR